MNVVLRAMLAYWILLIAVRLVGRRTASQMAPFDLVVLFLFGGATITSVLGEDHSAVAAYSAVCTIGLNHIAVSWLKLRSPLFGRLVDGTPVVIYENGGWHEKRMRGLRIERSDVMAAIRQSGLQRLEQIAYAVVERDGKVSVIPPGEDKG
ncbi:DUF421 domain-containing protein [Acetobacteraceae bacterium KSS8]|uniref:DUF421 domain-containing protein n=1 Tax=Endosaccharibacter trunci TaxID=2812733 RepID=A0ABT1WAK9_9PROT|nr:DUF421 domain-containing protein [Acetobacteraceae bacterium KSS8]